MIDRPARDRLAEQLRHLISGQITNYEFDGGEPRSPDPAVRAVFGMAWRLYDDLHEHRMTGLHHVTKGGRAEIARWILFLQSDLAYEWPPYDFIQIANSPLNVLTLGWWNRHTARRFAAFRGAGDWGVWPFLRRSDFEAARQQPRLLTGKVR